MSSSRAEIDSLLDQLQLDSADTMLEIGSGWGEMAIQAAKANPNLNVTSLTLSPEQAKICRERALAEGVADRIDFLEMDYRDLDPDLRFDRILSVEMIEAVAWQDAPVFFNAIDKHLDPDTGIAVLQTINVPPEQEARQRHHKRVRPENLPGRFTAGYEKYRQGTGKTRLGSAPAERSDRFIRPDAPRLARQRTLL